MQGIPVRYAMMTRFRSLAPDDLLQRAADELLAGAQRDFPVVDGNCVVGMLKHDDLIQAILSGQQQETVGSVMRRNCPIVSDQELLESVFRRMEENGCYALSVVGNDRLVGLTTLENIGELLTLRRSALDNETKSNSRSISRY
jgi:predicted transcriptional regulator